MRRPSGGRLLVLCAVKCWMVYGLPAGLAELCLDGYKRKMQFLVGLPTSVTRKDSAEPVWRTSVVILRVSSHTGQV